MKSKAGAWAIFLGVLLLLSFAATSSYSKVADQALIAFRLTLVVLLSLLLVRERWTKSDAKSDHSPDGSPRPETLLQRLRRWYYDTSSVPK